MRGELYMHPRVGSVPIYNTMLCRRRDRQLYRFGQRRRSVNNLSDREGVCSQGLSTTVALLSSNLFIQYLLYF